MFYSKENTQQIVPAGGCFLSDTYASYAEYFDLSLLPNDGEVPLSPQSEYSTIAAGNIIQQNYEQQLTAPEYIPATIFHDPIQPMKTEKDWCDTPITSPLDNTLNSQQAVLYQQQFDQQQQTQYSYQYPSPLPSPPQDNYLTIFPPSPCPSIELNSYTIKQEYGLLPPSPPDSNGVPSPLCDIKSEPETDTESSIDIDTLLKNSLETGTPVKKQITTLAQDHQLLREYLQDTSFQRKHNLKPLALESLIGGWGTRGDIEPVISLALEHAKRDVQATCAALNIPPDPQHWSTEQTYSWLQSTIAQYKLSPIQDMNILFPEDGAALSRLSEDEFIRRCPQVGGTLHAQLEVWKAACMDADNVCCSPTPVVQQQNQQHTVQADAVPIASPLSQQQQNITSSPVGSPQQINNVWSPAQSRSADVTDDEDEEMPLAGAPSPMSVASPTAIAVGSPLPAEATSSSAVTSGNSTPVTTASTTAAPSILPKVGRQGGSHIHLWQFLKELLASPQTHGTAIRWLDRNKGVFRIEDSVRVARLWGRRKNRPAMNYDKLSRSIRQYYKKGIMKKTERSQRLVYQFCHPYCL